MSVYDCLSKEAGFFSALKNLGKSVPLPPPPPPSYGQEILGNARSMSAKVLPALGLAGAAYAIPYGITSAKERAQRNAEKGDLEESYDKMFEKLPQLQEVIERDGSDQSIRENFNILASISPDVAKTPAMAAAFVHSALARGPELFTTGTVRDMAQLQGLMNQNRAPIPFDRTSANPFLLATAMNSAGKLM